MTWPSDGSKPLHTFSGMRWDVHTWVGILGLATLPSCLAQTFPPKSQLWGIPKVSFVKHEIGWKTHYWQVFLIWIASDTKDSTICPECLSERDSRAARWAAIVKHAPHHLAGPGCVSCHELCRMWWVWSRLPKMISRRPTCHGCCRGNMSWGV